MHSVKRGLTAAALLSQVYVGDYLCGTIKYDPLKYGYYVMCDEGHGVVGQKVKIVNDKTHLTLCEVKVLYLDNFNSYAKFYKPLSFANQFSAQTWIMEDVP